MAPIPYGSVSYALQQQIRVAMASNGFSNKNEAIGLLLDANGSTAGEKGSSVTNGSNGNDNGGEGDGEDEKGVG